MEEVKKGKKLLIAIMGIFLTMSFTLLVLNYSLVYDSGRIAEAKFRLIQGGIRFSLECLLFWLIYNGHNWARILAVVLFGFGAIISIVMISVDYTNYYMIVSALLFIVFLVILLGKPLKAFQEYRRDIKSNNDGF
jgi:hypothetical protein